MTPPSAPRPLSRTLAAIAAAGVLALGAGHASAAAPPAASGSAPMLMEVAGDRSGQLEVAGSGRVILSGRLAVQGELSGRGVLQVVDRAGDAKVYVAGRQVTLRRGRAIVRRSRGIVFVAGSNVSVVSTDKGTRLFVAGTATVRLAGSGIHRVNLGAYLPWPRAQFRLSAATRPSSGQRVQVRASARARYARERATREARRKVLAFAAARRSS